MTKRELADLLRKEGDLLWEQGEKERSARKHDLARELEVEIRRAEAEEKKHG